MIDQLIVRELLQSCAQFIRLKGRSGGEHLVREHSADARSKLGDLFGGFGAVEAGHQRAM